MNYTFIAIWALIILILFLYSRHKKKKTGQFLDLIKNEYKSEIKIKGKVFFSNIHILLSVDLTIMLSEKDIIIYGYDYYRHKKTKFLFHTDQKIPGIETNIIPNYMVINIQVNSSSIIVYGENDSKITFDKDQALLLLNDICFTNVITTLNGRFDTKKSHNYRHGS